MPFNLPPVTRNLLIANVLVFVLQLLLHDQTSLALTQHFALWPLGPDVTGATPDGHVITAGFRIWQVVTYALGPTDVAWEGWDKEYHAPPGIFPHYR